MALPVSHLFEFKGLSQDKEYDLVVKSSRDFMDRRHEPSVRVPVPVQHSQFLKVIVPLKATGALPA